MQVVGIEGSRLTHSGTVDFFQKDTRTKKKALFLNAEKKRCQISEEVRKEGWS